MKTLIKIIFAILGLLGLSGKATAKKKAEVKKIDKKVKQVKKARKTTQKKKTAVQKKKAEINKQKKAISDKDKAKCNALAEMEDDFDPSSVNIDITPYLSNDGEGQCFKN